MRFAYTRDITSQAYARDDAKILRANGGLLPGRWPQAWLTNAALYQAPSGNARWTIKSTKKTGTSEWQRTFAGGQKNRDPSVTLDRRVH